MSNKKIYMAMVLATFFWSGAFVAGKFSTPYIPTFTLTFLRFFFATGIMAILVRRNNQKLDAPPWKPTKQHFPFFCVTGIVGMFGYHVLFFQSLHYTGATNASMINGMNPIVTTLLAAIFLKETINRKQVLGIVISFVGAILTISGASWSVIASLSFNKGDFIMFAAMICWAIYGVFSKGKGKGIPPLQLTYYSFLFCTIFILPFVLWERPWTFLAEIPMIAWISVLYMSICPSVIGYLIQQISIKRIGPARTSIFINLVPAFSMALAVTCLGEPFMLVKVFTAALIILGVIVCQLSGGMKEK
ncbi:MAG: DMT family transporter [Anaerovoracaceae bacterium]